MRELLKLKKAFRLSQAARVYFYLWTGTDNMKKEKEKGPNNYGGGEEAGTTAVCSANAGTRT